MADWRSRFLTFIIVAPIIVYFILGQATTSIIAQVFVFIMHFEFSKMISQILNVNSTDTDALYIKTMEKSLFIRIPSHYYLTICVLLCDDCYLNLHFVISILMICFVRIYAYTTVGQQAKQNQKQNSDNLDKNLDRRILILTFSQMAADILQFTLFVYPLAFPILAFQYKQGTAMNVLWIISSWQTDNGALFIGSLMGKHPFSPKISPKKTWEGVIGGIFLSVVTSLLLSQLFFKTNLNTLHIEDFLIISLVIAIVSIFGDLVESFLKRVSDVKDSGTFFPGHGGVLDRMDSLCFSAPVVYLYMKIYMHSSLELIER